MAKQKSNKSSVCLQVPVSKVIGKSNNDVLRHKCSGAPDMEEVIGTTAIGT